MSNERRVGAMRITLGLAMRAMLGEPDPATLGRAIIAVGEVFPRRDPLAVSLRQFSEAFPATRHDPAALKAAGVGLFHAVRRAQPDPPRRH